MSYEQVALDLLGIDHPVPLTPGDMSRSLKVTFFPPHQETPRLREFVARLRETLIEVGARVLSFDDALDESGEKVRPGIVIIEQGEGREGELAVHWLKGLYQNPMVALYDGPPPFDKDGDLQQTLDAIVGVLAWNQTQVPIFVEDHRWTVATMNGAVIECGDWRRMHEDMLRTLVPKLTAQVVPPNRADITYREGGLDVVAEGYQPLVDDFMGAANVWRANGLMLAHTSIDSLRYRNRFYRRLVAAYLDKRTGMSYGFMARQLPVHVEPAQRVTGANANGNDTTGTMRLRCAGEEWLVPVPPVSVLSTRSGCEKTRLRAEKDLVRMTLQDGRILFDTPKDMPASSCRPSYDTLAILAHAAGNAIAASILAARDPDSEFAAALAGEGLSLCHWHGYPGESELPDGYALHGSDNPPVSCSTPQSAVYALAGKLAALDREITRGRVYLGDVHVEPHHGTNISGVLSLTASAKWVDSTVERVEA